MGLISHGIGCVKLVLCVLGEWLGARGLGMRGSRELPLYYKKRWFCTVLLYVQSKLLDPDLGLSMCEKF